MHIVSSKPEKVEPFKLFHIRHAVTRFGICFDGLSSHFGPVFSHNVPISSFRMSMYIQCHCALEEHNLLFSFYKGLQLRNCLKSQKRIWTENSAETEKEFGDF